jgi:membrane associated rhomboid family serine protease
METADIPEFREISMYFFYYIPVGLDIRRVRRGSVTLFLIAVCTGVFLLQRFLPSSAGFRAVNLLFRPENPNLATALSHAFFHAGWVHLAGNMLYLFLFGRALEDRFGPGRFFMIFAFSAVAGAYTHLFLVRLWNPDMLRVAVGGASGATSGLLGAFLVRFYFARIRVAYWVFMPLQGVNRAGRKFVPAYIAVAAWFVYQAVYALVQFHSGTVSVAYGVHVGGFLCGIISALAIGASSEAAGEKYLVQARRYFRRSKWYAAQGRYINYLKREPGDLVARAELARSYVCAGDFGSAQEHFGRAVMMHLERGERDSAEDLLFQAIKCVRGFRLDEDDFLDLAFGLERNMKFRRAAEAYRHFLHIYPVSGQGSFVLLRLAALQRDRLGDPGEALDTYRRIVNDFSESEWVDFARMELEKTAGAISGS